VSIEGKTIVFTGKISRPRYEFQDLVRQHGGLPSSSISRNTDYLVVGEKPGSKLAAAAALGILTITEEGFLSLLSPPVEEEPLTLEKLSEINSHIVTLTCQSCRRNYRQWDTLPNTETCPICGILLPAPLCPHCGNAPTYVEDYSLYTCMLCGTWFKAPYSIHTRHTKHLCFFQPTKQTSGGVYKTCLGCGNRVFLTNEDLAYIKSLYEKAPTLVQLWKEEEMEQEKEKEAVKFIQSLTEEQIEQLKEELNA